MIVSTKSTKSSGEEIRPSHLPEQERTTTGEQVRTTIGEQAHATPGDWRHYIYQILAAEISRTSRYYDRLIQLMPASNDSGLLLESVENQNKSTAKAVSDLRDIQSETNERTLILMNGTLNHELDIQGLLQNCREKLSRSSRIAVVAYNSYFSWLYVLANKIGLRRGAVPCTFLTEASVESLAKISGFEVVQMRHSAYVPFKLFGLGNLINSVMPAIPFLKRFSLAEILILRPIIASTNKPSLSIVIPARNEKGNIEDALKRIPEMGIDLEIIFVEGHSNDGTWEEIQRVIPSYHHRFPIHAFKQTGKGKADAVRLGFQKATKDILTILDADLSMPPELLTRFYDAYTQGCGDFINGNRLVYPIEGKAMKFLNKLGNIFFAKALSHVLGVKLGDSLCGTKLLSRADYARFCAWRRDFGDFDPFGDFELIFPAATLALGVCDIPIRYRDRLYGETNISRFRHGLMLLKMTLVGFFRITLGSISRKKSN